MDTKNILTFVVIAAMIFIGYNYFFNKPAAAPTVAPAPGLLALPENLEPFKPDGDWAAPATRILGEAKKGGNYKLQLEIDNQNAGVNSIKLSDYDQDVEKKADQEKDAKANRMELLGPADIAVRAFSTLKIAVDDKTATITRGNVLTTWQFVETKATDEVRLRVWGGDKANPEYELFKVFHIVSPANYDVDISYEFVNHAGAAKHVTIDQAGCVGMVRDSSQYDMRVTQGSSFASGTTRINPDFKVVAQTEFTKTALASRDLGSFSAPTDPLVWAATSNRFFTIISRPIPTPTEPVKMLPLSSYRGKGHDIQQVSSFGAANAEIVVPPASKMADWADHPEKWVMGTTLRGNTVEVAPNTTAVVMSMRVYFGPQARDLLKGDASAAVGTDAYDYDLYSYLGVINFKRAGCSFFVFQPLAIFILGLLDIVHYVTFGNYGLAIILLVIVVRLMLHPLTRYSQVSIAKMQQKMKAVQPEMDRVKKKYAKDRAKLSEETMRIYKENNINPAGQVLGCLPMLLQMPIWTALYSGLAVDIDLRHAGFIPGWINDLSNPDTLIRFHDPITIPVISSLMRGPITGINLLPILLGVVFFMQQRIQAKTMPKPQDEAQAKTQAFSQYMILLFPFFLYSAPSGLNLYIFASTSGGILDTWLVRRHLREKGIIPALPEK